MQLSIPSSFLLHNGLLGRGWQRLYWQSPAILWCFCPWTLPIFVIFSRCLIGPVPRTWDLPSVGFLGPQDRKEWRPGRPHIVSHRSLPGFHLSGFCITSVALVMLVGFLAPFTSCRMASRYLSSLFLPPSVASRARLQGRFLRPLGPLGHWPETIFLPLLWFIGAPPYWIRWGAAASSLPKWGSGSEKWTLGDWSALKASQIMRRWKTSSWEDQSWRKPGSRRQVPPLWGFHQQQGAGVPKSLLSAFVALG